MPAAWNHVGDVEKNGYPHPNRQRDALQNKNRTAPQTNMWQHRTIHIQKKKKRKQPQKNFIYR
jgi:hypothetical protein